MRRRDFLKKCGAIVAGGFVLPNRTFEIHRGSKRPNILFIMSDQHNARALSCYGNNQISTPSMDRLAAKGLLFERAFCQTGQCVPSRYSIFTGRYARSHGTYSNGQTQNPEEKTVAELFGEAGYVTGTIGKHHMVMNKVTHNHGFELVSTPSAPGLTKEGTFLPYEEVHPGRAAVGETTLSNDEHRAGQITTEVIEFLRENKDRPFVLWYSFWGPHTPICPSVPWSRQYDPDQLTLPPNLGTIDEHMPGVEKLLTKSGKFSEEHFHRQTLAYYYGLVSQIDYNIGRVLNELDALDLSDNTIVVYTADHGEMMAEHGAWTKGRTGYDAQIRVPLIIRWPGNFSTGKRLSELVCSIDLLPTLLDAAGLAIPDNVQGLSLVPLVQGNTEQWRDYAFSEIGGSTKNTCIMTRSQTHKYILFRTDDQTEHEQLFDLVKDPWEMHNAVADERYAEVLTDLRGALARWESQTPSVAPMESR